jgi:hypothetical protein
MEKWRIRAFDSELNIYEHLAEDEDVLKVTHLLRGEECSDCEEHIKAVTIYKSVLQRSIIEGLLISEDCTIAEAAQLTGVKEEILEVYNKIFFRYDDAFSSKIDMIDFIETGVSYYGEIEDDEMLNIFLLLRWSISLGKEFIVWKFRLSPTEYVADRLYNVVMKEAFFYHKEKAMGNTDISLTEYLRSANTLLSSVKTSTTIKKTSEDDAGFDILDQLGIIVEEKEAPAITLGEISGENLINNALQQETK